MIKYFCDKCGKEVGNAEDNQIVTVDLLFDIPMKRGIRLCLCTDCADKVYDLFEKWESHVDY